MLLSLLELGTLEVALEAQLETYVDTRHHAEPVTEASSDEYRTEMAELDVCIDETSALLAKVKAELQAR